MSELHRRQSMKGGEMSIPAESNLSPYIISRNVDYGVMVAGAIMMSILIFLTWQWNAGFLLLTVLFAIFFDLPHVLQTSVRVLMDPQERALHGRHFIVSLAVFAAVISWMLMNGHLPVLLIVWVIWQFFHVVKQHFGIINIYAGKARSRTSRTPVKFLLFAGCIAPFLYRLSEGMAFSEYVVFGDRLPFSGLAMPSIPVGDAGVALAYVVFACTALVYVWQQAAARRRGIVALPVPANVTLVVAVVSYNLAYLFISDLYALILVATATHSLQYHVISVARHRGRFGSVADGADSRLLLRRIVVSGGWGLYFTALFAAGGAVASMEMLWLGAVPLTIVLHHFYMDGFVWKAKYNPRLASDLGLVSPRPAKAGA